MDVREAILKRRSIRKYLDKDIEEEKITELLESMRKAPSAKNRQPWRIMILKNEEKDQVGQIMLDFLDTNEDLPSYVKSSKVSANIIKNAPLLFLVFREEDNDWIYGDVISSGAAIENICLTAVDLGLGTVWIRDTVYAENEILEYVGYPELELVSAITVGYPDENPPMRPRKKMEEIVIKKR